MPSSCSWNRKRTRSPGLKRFGRPEGGAAKSIVIALQCADGIAPCEIVRPSLVTASMRPTPSCSMAAAAGAEAAGGDAMRWAVPRRLASESIRNCPETTTFCPALKPSVTSVCPLASAPVLTSMGLKPPLPASTMTIVRVPVRINASVGTSSLSGPACAPNRTLANMPGKRRRSRFWSSTRTLTVRVLALTSGRMASTLPVSACPAIAVAVAVTAWPGRMADAWLSGISAKTHTVDKSAILKSVMPGATAMPSRTPTSVMTPSMSLEIASRGCGLPVDSTSRICASVMPAWRMRSNAALRRSPAGRWPYAKRPGTPLVRRPIPARRRRSAVARA